MFIKLLTYLHWPETMTDRENTSPLLCRSDKPQTGTEISAACAWKPILRHFTVLLLS